MPGSGRKKAGRQKAFPGKKQKGTVLVFQSCATKQNGPPGYGGCFCLVERFNPASEPVFTARNRGSITISQSFCMLFAGGIDLHQNCTNFARRFTAITTLPADGPLVRSSPSGWQAGYTGCAAVKAEVQQLAQHPVVAGLHDRGGLLKEAVIRHRQKRICIGAEGGFVLPQIRPRPG